LTVKERSLQRFDSLVNYTHCTNVNTKVTTVQSFSYC